MLFCRSKYDDVKIIKALELSGRNRTELEKVINFYKESPKDSLKLRAAYFLIGNMSSKYSIIPVRENDSFLGLLNVDVSEEQAWDPKESNMGRLLDSLYHIETPLKEKHNDLEVITADYLIENIDAAFNAWHGSKQFTNYSFKTFCEYILPYRIGSEPLSDWRKIAYKNYKHLLDSLTNPIDIAKRVVRESNLFYNAGMSKYPYPLSYSEIHRFHWGTCEHLAHYLALSLRSLGIAATVDIVPAWANRSSGHVWNIIFINEGEFVDFGFSHDGGNKVVYKVPKVYRTTYSNNLSCILPNWKDVTSSYNLPINSLEINYSEEVRKLFLCVFNNKEWVPVAFVNKPFKTKKNIFRDVGKGILFGGNKIEGYENEGKGVVYLPAKILKGNVISKVYPIILYENGTIRELKPKFSALEDVELFRKYPRYNYIFEYAKNMIGGEFRLSKELNLKKSKLFYTIEKVPSLSLNKVKLNKSYCGRYLWYVASSQHRVDASEFAFYSDEKKLVYRPLPHSGEGVEKLFDDNVDTYYSGLKGEVLVFDLGEVRHIDRLCFSPRSDGNDIVIGELYELFYWDKEWVSLGIKEATSQALNYSNVPKNSLLLLRNYTKGVEERIFTYEKGKQIWW